jgi:hypothetical protein
LLVKEKEKFINKNIALKTAGVIFAVVALLHLLRVVTGFEVAIGGKTIPLWPSIGGLIVGGLLAIWMFLAARR